MPRLQARSVESSVDVRHFPHGHASVLPLDEAVVGYAVYEPGWRWTTDMPAIAGTATCQFHHVGYAVSGALHVVTDAGQELDVREQSFYEIPPGTMPGWSATNHSSPSTGRARARGGWHSRVPATV